MERRDVKWLKKGTHEKHLSVLDFKKKERAKEVAALEVQIANSNELLKATDNLISERTDIAEKLELDNAELSSENESLEKKQESLQKEIEGLTGSKKKLERNVRAYDEDPRWQLPEPALMQSAKSYKDKEASPLVSMLKDLVKNLTIQCVQFMEQVKKLTKRMEKQDADIQSYKNKVKVQGDRIEELEVDSADLKLLEGYLGEEKSRSILENVKDKERAEKASMQTKKVLQKDMSR